MKKLIPFIFLGVLISIPALAQQQLENPGFEDWEDPWSIGFRCPSTHNFFSTTR